MVVKEDCPKEAAMGRDLDRARTWTDKAARSLSDKANSKLTDRGGTINVKSLLFAF